VLLPSLLKTIYSSTTASISPSHSNNTTRRLHHILGSIRRSISISIISGKSRSTPLRRQYPQSPYQRPIIPSPPRPLSVTHLDLLRGVTVNQRSDVLPKTNNDLKLSELKTPNKGSYCVSYFRSMRICSPIFEIFKQTR